MHRAQYYFWRLHSGAEIDYIETGENMAASGFKYSDIKAGKFR